MDGYQLGVNEVRVLAALAEKQALTPDTYPMTLNTLIGASNQLTSRDPVLKLEEGDVQLALDALIARKLVAERTPAGSRVAKYEHRMPYEWNLDGARQAALCLLMLRGAQTAAEIRARSGRIYAFSSADEVEQALSALADKYPPMVQKLARQAGAREARWVHLLAGDVLPEEAPSDAAPPAFAARIASLEAQVETLTARLASLEAQWSA
jgi:uncharacterized protein YceH (UPF0502 family)